MASSLFAARLLSYALLLLVAGLPLHAFFGGCKRFCGRERLALAAIAVAAVPASIWWSWANVAAMAGLPLAALDRATYVAVLGATPLGTLLAVRGAALAGVVVLLVLAPKPRLLAPFAAVALASIAWAGHPGAGEGLAGGILRLGDLLHLTAGAVWLGALVTFLAAVYTKRELVPSLVRFARTGTVVVATLFVSGLVNAALITGSTWPGGTWLVLIAVKAGLFLAMLGLAAHNRWRLVPELAAGRPFASRRLLRSLLLETACGLAVVAVVAAAGLLDPHGG